MPAPVSPSQRHTASVFAGLHKAHQPVHSLLSKSPKSLSLSALFAPVHGRRVSRSLQGGGEILPCKPPHKAKKKVIASRAPAWVIVHVSDTRPLFVCLSSVGGPIIARRLMCRVEMIPVICSPPTKRASRSRPFVGMEGGWRRATAGHHSSLSSCHGFNLIVPRRPALELRGPAVHVSRMPDVGCKVRRQLLACTVDFPTPRTIAQTI